MKVIKGNTKKRKSLVLRVAILAFSAYVLVMMAQLRMEIDRAQKQTVEIGKEKEAVVQQIADLRNKIDNYELYLEQRAREQGMAIPGERIYQETQGAN